MLPELKSPVVFLTCEHAGNVVPPDYQPLFRDQEAVLKTHRGYDPGALAVALKLADRLATPLQFTQTTRLLIDTNRSAQGDQLFSEITQNLGAQEKQVIVDTYYKPYRQRIESLINAIIHSGDPVLHIAVHSFVDVFNGLPRDFEIGLLYDPQRPSEAGIAARWLQALGCHARQLKCVGNKPYLGTDDGLTAALRRQFPPGKYAGFEIEIRQGVLGSEAAISQIADALSRSIKQLDASVFASASE